MEYYWYIAGGFVLFVSMLLTGIIIPQILLIAFRKELFDDIDERKIHTSKVPRLGGIAFMPSVLFAVALTTGISVSFGDLSIAGIVSRNGFILSFGMCAIITMYLVGMADDLIGVRYSAKFIAQILTAMFIIFAGVRIYGFPGIPWISELPVWLSVALSVLVIVFIINAINLIDGIDGLASGLSSVALTFYAFFFFKCDYYFCSLLSLAALGTQFPFFYYNVFGNAQKHKKIFMGDTGSLTVGTILSLLAIRMSNVATMVESPENPIVLGFAPLIIPCLDVIRVFFRRIRHGHSPFLPDKTHIHHKFLALGLSHRVAMMSIIAIAVVAAAINIVLSHYIGLLLLVAVNLVVWIVFNILLTRSIRRREVAINSPTPLYQ